MTRDAIWQEFNRRMIRAANENPGDAAVRDSEQQITVAWFHDMMARNAAEDFHATAMREQTAATLLAALIQVLNDRPAETSKEDAAKIAVAWTDALRDALKGAP